MRPLHYCIQLLLLIWLLFIILQDSTIKSSYSLKVEESSWDLDYLVKPLVF